MRLLPRVAATGLTVAGLLSPVTAGTALAGVPCYFHCYECVTEPCCQPEPPIMKTVREVLPGEDACDWAPES